jgi:phosphoenolpyruvate synthase/pyruvate phosphate dikinase
LTCEAGIVSYLKQKPAKVNCRKAIVQQRKKL